MSRKHLTEEKIIEMTLTLIEQKGSATAVNFREVARGLGCAHTSLYNFFESYQALLMASAASVVKRMREKQVFTGDVGAYAEGIIDFAILHPGWYRFLWMDYMDVQPSMILGHQERPERMLLEAFLLEQKSSVSKELALKKLSIGQGYLHGEICKYLSGRSMYLTQEVFKKEVLDHLNWLMKVGG